MSTSPLAAATDCSETKQNLEHRYQQRVAEWLTACFGQDVALDKRERMHRFLEEALELAQAAGCTRQEATLLLNYVFSRPTGHLDREVGGVLVTLAGICHAHGVDLKAAGERELARNESRTAEIRAKRERKWFGSPLP